MAGIVVIDERDGVANVLVTQLRAGGNDARREHCGDTGWLIERAIDVVVYAPPLGCGAQVTPDLVDAEAVFGQCARIGVQHVVVLSSALIYGASPQNPGLITEARAPLRGSLNPIGLQWAELEALAQRSLANAKLTILRSAAAPQRGGADYFSRLFAGKLALTLPGHDPSLQLLSAEDLARAVACAVERSAGGVYNVAPDGVIPLGKALRLSGARRLPVPRTVQRLARPVAPLDFIRYSWTVSNRKIKDELGFRPQRSSAEALQSLVQEERSSIPDHRSSTFDDFGLDTDYLAAFGQTLFKFLERYYWRIEVNGLERVPDAGRAVVVGMHRAFMPWDGILIIHQIFQKAGRVPRFLMHPGLVKLPFCFNFMTKIGAVIACQENAAHVLEREELLGVFPEGVNGAFTLYRDAYRLGKFGRHDFVKLALRHRAPIIPFVTIGSAEIFPILKKLEWRWWKRRTDWPCLPLTPTFPLVPLPLPSKWHTQFLEPLDVAAQYGAEAAEDPVCVRAISDEVRDRMAVAMEEILRRRKSIFYGSVFEQEAG